MASRDGAEGADADAGRRSVARVFASVAGRYDAMNDLMSFGVHRLWRRALAAELGAAPGARVIDIAGGTGDVALRLAGDGRSVVVCDANPAMLGEGRRRAWDRGSVRGVDWICGDAEALPFPRSAFDAAAVAFGLRNFADMDRALAEAARVLRPGGRLACLEFAPNAAPSVAPWLAPFYRAWSDRAIPALGEAVTGDRAAYEYLVESIRRFPPPDAVSAAFVRAGFADVRARALSGGIAWLHSGWRA